MIVNGRSEVVWFQFPTNTAHIREEQLLALPQHKSSCLWLPISPLEMESCGSLSCLVSSDYSSTSLFTLQWTVFSQSPLCTLTLQVRQCVAAHSCGQKLLLNGHKWKRQKLYEWSEQMFVQIYCTNKYQATGEQKKYFPNAHLKLNKCRYFTDNFLKLFLPPHIWFAQIRIHVDMEIYKFSA